VNDINISTLINRGRRRTGTTSVPVGRSDHCSRRPVEIVFNSEKCVGWSTDVRVRGDDASVLESTVTCSEKRSNELETLSRIFYDPNRIYFRLAFVVFRLTVLASTRVDDSRPCCFDTKGVNND